MMIQFFNLYLLSPLFLPASISPYFSIFSHLLRCVQSELLYSSYSVIPKIVQTAYTSPIPSSGDVIEAEGEILQPPKGDTPLADVKISPLMNCLRPDTLMQLLSALMCER
jgi:hypothetical protein